MRKHISLQALLIAFVSTVAFAQGVHTWYGNQEFMGQLDQSISAFFGNSVGSYVRVYEYGKLSPEQQAEKASIANQFLSIFGHGGPDMQQLPDGNTLYEYFAPHDGAIRVAIVTPKYNTNVLAAAVTHWTCGALPAADIHNAAAVQSNYISPKCNQPTVTVFFKNQASVNSVIRKELVKWGMEILLGSCQSMNHVIAEDGGSIHPCHASYKVVTLSP
jgi:hypothetical protein